MLQTLKIHHYGPVCDVSETGLQMNFPSPRHITTSCWSIMVDISKTGINDPCAKTFGTMQSAENRRKSVTNSGYAYVTQ